jgi:hypothetical protein
MARTLRTLALLVLAVPALALAKAAPEDSLKGQIIISDRKIPSNWSSVGSYVAQLKGMKKESFWYDKKTNKVTLQYAAFFAQPVMDVQVDFQIYDITGGQHQQKITSEAFMNRGDRVLFNSVELSAEDFEGNKKYQMQIAYKHKVIASGTFILRAEGPHYSGKVSFTDDDTKEK